MVDFKSSLSWFRPLFVGEYNMWSTLLLPWKDVLSKRECEETPHTMLMRRNRQRWIVIVRREKKRYDKRLVYLEYSMPEKLHESKRTEIWNLKPDYRKKNLLCFVETKVMNNRLIFLPNYFPFGINDVKRKSSHPFVSLLRAWVHLLMMSYGLW